MLIVSSFILADVILLIVYIVLEGVVAHFSAGTDLNEERPNSVYGVSMKLSYNVRCYRVIGHSQ